MPKDDEEQITISRKDLDDLLAKRERDAKMSDDERNVRKIVREEVGSILDEKLSTFFDFADDKGDEDREDNDGGSLGTLGKVFGLGGKA
jgi:hypothetical protein